MKFIITKDFEELSLTMCNCLLKHMYPNNKKRVNIAITTGETPVLGYKMLANVIKDKNYFKHVNYYIFDEFWYKDDPIGICRRSLDRKFFNLANISEEQIHNLYDKDVDTMDDQIINDGGLDVVIMGIGKNGHFCGNQPGTFKSWDEGVHFISSRATETVKNLMLTLLKDDLNSDDISRIPDHYITMGPKTIMGAKSIIFILSGEEKADVAKKAFFEPISIDYPVSIFQLHQDVTIIIDESAATNIKKLIKKI